MTVCNNIMDHVQKVLSNNICSRPSTYLFRSNPSKATKMGYILSKKRN